MALRPHRCVILAVDPSQASSGWAILLDGRLVEWGRCPADDFTRVAAVVERALRLGVTSERPVAVVGESWGRGGRLASARTSQGMGAAWGAWAGLCRAARVDGKRILRKRILRVPVSTWRAKFGLPSRWGTETLKRAAVQTVWLRHSVRLEEYQHDIAEAILIGAWASQARAVEDVL